MTTLSAREATITASLFAPGSLCGRLLLTAALTTAACSARPATEAAAPAIPETPPPKTTPNAKDLPDPDLDGVKGDHDRCPDDPEDKDAFEDEDGCPDPDNDLDHIPDVTDKCPNEPETYNGYEDEDGCPDKGRIILEPKHTERWRSLPFDEGLAIVGPRAQSTLEAIAALLRSQPGLGVLHVRGAARGDAALAGARASNVVEALARRGVRPDRMRSVPGTDDDLDGVTLELVEA